MKVIIKKLSVLAIIVTVGIFLVNSEAMAGGFSKPPKVNPWSMFGNAVEVVGGLCCDYCAIELSSVATTYSGINFNPPKKITFADLKKLSVWFNVTATDCGGGSPRFQIAIDTTGDGNSDGNIFIYLGPAPNFVDCAFGWQSSGNLIGIPDTDKRYDLTQLGGTFYDTYSNALALLGTKAVLSISLVVDSGWMSDFVPQGQVIQIDELWINNYKLTQPVW
jgi:hypothetical protein